VDHRRDVSDALDPGETRRREDVLEALLLGVEIAPPLGRRDRQVEVERVLAREPAPEASLVARIRPTICVAAGSMRCASSGLRESAVTAKPASSRATVTGMPSMPVAPMMAILRIGFMAVPQIVLRRARTTSRRTACRL
jgi:hypothetical protein